MQTMAWTDDVDDLPIVYKFGYTHGWHEVLSETRLQGIIYNLLFLASCRLVSSWFACWCLNRVPLSDVPLRSKVSEYGSVHNGGCSSAKKYVPSHDTSNGTFAATLPRATLHE